MRFAKGNERCASPRRHKSSIARRNDAHERTIWRRLRRLERRNPRRRRPSSVTMKKISFRYARRAKINQISQSINPRLGKKAAGGARSIHIVHSFVSSMRDARRSSFDRCDGRSFVRSIDRSIPGGGVLNTPPDGTNQNHDCASSYR